MCGVEKTSEEHVLEAIQKRKEVNRWRSATFHSIASAVMPRDEMNQRAAADAKTELGDLVVTPFIENQTRVRDDILAILTEVTEGGVGKEIEDEVANVTALAGELALEAGVHRSFLSLSSLDRGDVFQVGFEFIDCEDGDSARGLFATVDLVVSPHFVRVGDGRGDLATKRTICHGEIYPARSADGQVIWVDTPTEES